VSVRLLALMVPALAGALGPQAAGAADRNLAALQRYSGSYGSSEQVRTANQFSDLQPSDWAYQALSTLVERHGCIAGYPDGGLGGARSLSRFEAAALLNACLDQITDTTDSLRRLLREFERELAILRGPVDGLAVKVGNLEAQTFSSTTKLSGQTTFVLGANRFGGIATGGPDGLQAAANRREGGTTFNYDLQLDLDTSFSGKDLLRIKLRAGNFAESGFGAGVPIGTNQAALFPNQLEIAFQEECSDNNGQVIDCGDVVGVQRAFYQFPIGPEFTATVGALVRQDDMLALWPSAYPADTLLDFLTYAGAPGAYNSNLGAGVGLWWKKGNWSVSLNYIAGNGNNGTPGDTEDAEGNPVGGGGIGTVASAQTSTVQLGYAADALGFAVAYTYARGVGVASGTPLAVLEVSAMNAIGISGYWQPSSSSWLPSISAGWGVNTYPGPSTYLNIDVQQSQSWFVGLQWSDVLLKGNKAGMAVGQPTFVTRCGEGCNGNPQDGQYAWEWWYSFQITDNITVTPALFYLSNLLGQISKLETGSNAASVSDVGALVKTTFRF
jgi:hypothetical protein